MRMPVLPADQPHHCSAGPRSQLRLCVRHGQLRQASVNELRPHMQNGLKWLLLYHIRRRSPITRTCTGKTYSFGVFSAELLTRVGTSRYPVKFRLWKLNGMVVPRAEICAALSTGLSCFVLVEESNCLDAS